MQSVRFTKKITEAKFTRKNILRFLYYYLFENLSQIYFKVNNGWKSTFKDLIREAIKGKLILNIQSLIGSI